MKASRARFGAQIRNKGAKAAVRAAQHGAPLSALVATATAAVPADVSGAFATVIAPRFREDEGLGGRKRKAPFRRGSANSTPLVSPLCSSQLELSCKGGSGLEVEGEQRGVRSEHFIPFRKKDFHTEKGYPLINTAMGRREYRRSRGTG